MKPDISMCWDGMSRTAELTVDGTMLEGFPRDVQDVFKALSDLRDRAYANLRNALDRIRP